MTEPQNTENAANKFDDKLHKLIKRAKKNAGCSGQQSFPS
jgi:hypothetical protein